jgi:hypothetical protein
MKKVNGKHYAEVRKHEETSKPIFCRVPIKVHKWLQKQADDNDVLLTDVIRAILRFARDEEFNMEDYV